MSSILISKPRLCLKLLFDPRLVSLAPLSARDLPFLFKVSELPRAHARSFCTKGVNRPVGHNRRDERARDERGREDRGREDRAREDRAREDRGRDDRRRDDRPREDSVRERPSFPKSVFAAGTAKRTSELMRRKFGQQQEGEEPDRAVHRKPRARLEPPDRPLSAAEWRELRDGFTAGPDAFAVHMMLALFNRGGTELAVAKSLLAFVATETGTLPYALLLRYLTLCVAARHHDEVFDLYDIMRARHRSLDTGAYSLFIKGFSRTERWRQALDVLQDIKRLVTPSPRNYGDTIDGAVRGGDLAVAWALYDEVIEQGLVPHQETWVSLFRGGAGAGGAGQEERLRGVLSYMRENQVYPQEGLARTISTWFQSLPDQTWTGNWTTVDPRGVCRSCGEQLESIQLTGDEYGRLRERVMRDIIQGRDVFHKTTPEELQSFMAFVQSKPAFDLVIDGLNVANTNSKSLQGRQSETLLAVVCELSRQGQAMLVLGRRHMLKASRRWDRHHMSQIQQKAHCFFTDNISEDDPFLLYATLHSGNQCNFLSRDLMRDHKACLGSGVSRRLFFKWQRGHQLVLSGYSPDRRVRFQTIPSYDTIVQTTGRSWHIPYDEDGTERSSYEVPERWLCLTHTH